MKTMSWPFNAYMSVLSALYVGGFERVYVHGNIHPSGEWWDRLKDENVTFVEMDAVETVFQQGVASPAHNSDIIRTLVLLKHGGVYQDWDVIWTNPVPRALRRYPAVLSTDWPRYGDFPGAFNLGVLMAKPKAQFLRHFVDSF
ncbi:uncharacterized protein LOC106011545, partial [Aplysia californica]|uniref:Uncharacterized protein LOC106011545 n=1 Tax=Aplysia californica TaxID=6500 RepID=A0ABM0ZYD4_APLCA